MIVQALYNYYPIICAAALVSFLYFSFKRPRPIVHSTTPKDQVTKQGFSSKKVPNQLDVIVIGSGMGGLTCAALLAKQGKRVLVLEQHDVIGGNTHTFVESGFEFDTGLHYVGGHVGSKRVSGLGHIFKYLTDGKVKWEKMDNAYDTAGISDSIEPKFEINAIWTTLIPNLKSRFPNEIDAIDEFFSLVKHCNFWFPVYMAANRLPAWFKKAIYLCFGNQLAIFQKTCQQVLETITQDEKLRGVLGYCFGGIYCLK
jgi:all-trans-retinol 13,14-reductase